MNNKIAKSRWFLPTNTENLELILSNGLITCVAGRNGFTKDSVSDTKVGYIPFFSETNLSMAIQCAQKEDKNLIVCLIEFDLDQIKHLNIFAESGLSENKFSEIDITEIRKSDEWQKLFIPAPLPLQCIKYVLINEEKYRIKTEKRFLESYGFARIKKINKKDNQLFKDDLLTSQANTENSVDINNADSLKSQDNMQSHYEETAVNFIQLPAPRNLDYNKIFSFGGMLALMYYQTKNGRDSLDLFKLCCELNKFEEDNNDLFKTVYNYYFYQNDKNIISDKILSLLSDNSKCDVSEVRALIMEVFNQNSQSFEDVDDESVTNISKWLEEVNDRVSNKSPEEWFALLSDKCNDQSLKTKHYRYYLSKVLLMFFNRDNIETMLKFHHNQFKETDYILFAMFYGIYHQYNGLPDSLKTTTGLGDFISNRMAEYGHIDIEQSSERIFNDTPEPLQGVEALYTNNTKEKNADFVDKLLVHLKQESDEIIDWYIQHSGEFSCDKKSIIKSDNQPRLEPKIKSDLINSGQDSNLSTIKLDDYIHWQSEFKTMKCETRSPLKFNKKPRIKAEVNTDILAEIIRNATIGNDKELFNFNELNDLFRKI